MTPDISIITINYNDLDGLYGTLCSIAAQEYRSFELIVVDGHSDDGSAKLLEDFAPLIDRWVSEPDGGIYDAMNKGVALARGTYVNFMNAGDCFYDGSVLDCARAVIAAEQPEIFCGRAYAQHSGKLYKYNDALWKAWSALTRLRSASGRSTCAFRSRPITRSPRIIASTCNAKPPAPGSTMRI